MRTTLLILLLATLPFGRLAAQPKEEAGPCLLENTKKTKATLSKAQQLSDIAQIFIAHRIATTECRSSLKGKAKGPQLRDVFVCGLQVDAINTLSPETLDKSNCLDRLLRLQSDSSGSVFSDGEFNEDLTWISEAVEKFCQQSQTSVKSDSPRSPAEKVGTPKN